MILKIFGRARRARAKIFSVTEDFKNLFGLRVVFILPYAVPGACHSIPNYIILVIDLFFAIVPNDVISASFTSLAFQERLYLY